MLFRCVQKCFQFQIFSWMFEVHVHSFFEKALREIFLCISIYSLQTPGRVYNSMFQKERIIFTNIYTVCSTFHLKLIWESSAHVSTYGSTFLFSMATHHSIVHLYYNYYNISFNPLAMNT